jgi:acetyltransferase-like isoleucine patch superfamily enzyme
MTSFRVLHLDTLRWVVRNRAWTWFYLVRYWRFLLFRVRTWRNPEVVVRGFVFLGKGVELHAAKGRGRLVLGRWVHIGDGCALRAHEGTLHVGNKVVFGQNNRVNCWMDVRIDEGTLVSDWVYIGDFDHRFDDITRPVKDQGIVKSPVTIGCGCWLGVKSSVLRGSDIGDGAVIGAHTVVRGTVPAGGVAVGVPARVVQDRAAIHEAQQERRIAEADIARKTALAAAQSATAASV